jgi:hypothetical protein
METIRPRRLHPSACHRISAIRRSEALDPIPMQNWSLDATGLQTTDKLADLRNSD